MATKEKRTICFPITSRIHWARQKRLLGVLNEHPEIDLKIVVAGSILLEKYGERFLPEIEASGLVITDTLHNVVEGGNHVTMAKTAGLTALEITNTLYKLKPDIVVIRGDRFEMLAIAMVAAYLNIPIAHIEGGDLSGTIDESVRHAITKLSHIHFVTNEDSRKRVIQMGENPERVHNVGSLDIEFAVGVRKKISSRLVNQMGTGSRLDLSKPFLMVVQHPVTTEADNRKHLETTLSAVSDLGMQTLWFWPNSDAGTNEMAKAIRVFREGARAQKTPIHFITDLLPEGFVGLLKKTACLVGNSSSGIKEASYFGTPVVNIGTRQQGRLRGPNVVDVGYDKAAISAAIKKQIQHGSYARSLLYCKPNTSERILETLLTIPLQSQKVFWDRKEG